ncbi:uncharacterized protein LOC128274186 [Anopheles cruzii]|uniref:uncharacterized protein LOC128274186 n=1 Tax=Anopheles cruzii TaxID=68878 RepID=UPI0022EC1FAE|nr:uncharacterized protein LOC128274186 [Anopheles cruzii]
MDFIVLLLNGWYFFMIVYSVYYIYVFSLNRLREGLDAEDIKAFVNPFTFLFYQCTQLYFMVLIPTMCTEQARKVVPLLNSVSVQYAEHQTDSLIEILTIDCLERDVDITNYGLYSINRGLLFGMIATMSSYMIILVQFHIERQG